jgi:hypothetical protein
MLHARLVAVAFAFSLAGLAKAQIPPPPAVAAEPSPAPVSRQCESAQRRVAKEERALATADEAIAASRKARQTCASRGGCARHDQAIKATEARRSRHDARLGKFRLELAKACKTG